MSIASIILTTAILSQTAPPVAGPEVAPKPAEKVTLERVYPQGKRLTYKLVSKLFSEERDYSMDTFMPEVSGTEYTFMIDVLQRKPDGIATVLYRRPTITAVVGETALSDERRVNVKLDWILRMTVSPVNEVLGMVDETPKKPEPKKKPEESTPESSEWIRSTSAASAVQPELIVYFAPYISEIYRLASFTGSFDSSLDLAPSFPFDPVSVGETWKKTVGYSPQPLRGSKKAAMQRLDYNYTYRGMTTFEGKSYQWVTAELKVNSDIAGFFKGQFSNGDEIPITKVPLKLNANVDFYLDPVTLSPIKTRARSEGEWAMWSTLTPGQASAEGRLKGDTTLDFVSATAIPAAKPSKPASKPKRK
ncbi:MAG: hypothetical protein JNM85_11210 [Chthonomonas sp.]|nr:hypothetical protein [Chthonomonas sp.]